MAIGKSKLTSQGQVSVPARIRQKLGLGPGSVIEWDASGDTVVVKRVGQYSSEEIHRAVFPAPPAPRTVRDLKEGIRRHIRKRHASR